MPFLSYIVDQLNDISGFFYDAYLTVYDWVYPFSLLDEPLYYLSWGFYYLARYFSDFNAWVDDVQAKVVNILSYVDIYSYFKTYFDYAIDAYYWVRDAFWNVTDIIADWWLATRYTVLDWIADLESWTQTQLNSLQNTLTTLVTDLGAWTSTQLNNLQATFNALISNVEAWTITQIDNVKSAILAIISDVELWTQTELNTIRATLTTLINWTALLAWITTWWSERLGDVQSLIDSAFLLRSSFWEGWQDWRAKVTEFFTDPEDWLYKSLDRIIERFW